MVPQLYRLVVRTRRPIYPADYANVARFSKHTTLNTVVLQN